MKSFTWFGILIWAVVLGGALTAGATIGLWFLLTKPGPTATVQTIYIPQGASLTDISQQLETENFVRSAFLMRTAAYFTGLGTRLRAGEFEVEAGLSYFDLSRALGNAVPIQRQITFPEGVTSYGVAERLKAAFGLVGGDTISLDEGSILPDTYAYTRGESAETIVRRMQKARDHLLMDLWEQRDPSLPYDSPEDAVVMASIIERETGVDTERRRVASVFVNRLRIGMRLQSDPTVIYGVAMGKPFTRSITRADLAAENPYNTYRIGGLPLGPIAHPGRASLEAALDPEQTEYLYFVADGSGGHVFAKTLAQHNKNVSAWRALRRKQAMSAEPDN